MAERPETGQDTCGFPNRPNPLHPEQRKNGKVGIVRLVYLYSEGAIHAEFSRQAMEQALEAALKAHPNPDATSLLLFIEREFARSLRRM